MALLVIVSFNSCNDEDNFAFQNVEPVFKIIAPTSGTTIVIDNNNMSNVALTLIWEGETSENYTVEFAVSESNFIEPIIAGTTTEENISWTNSELNSFLLDNVFLDHSLEAMVDVRIKNDSEEYSDIVTLAVTPYVVEVSQLFINGTFNNFDATMSIPMARDDFNVFSGIVELADGDEINFIEDNVTGEIVWQETEANSGMLTKYGGINISGLEAGYYRFDINLVDFTISSTLIVQPKIAVPGNHQGWDPGSAPLLAASSATTTDYEGYVWLDGEHKFVAPDNNGVFAWGNVDWGDDGSFSGLLLVDGEVNCSASAGYYFVQVDTNTLTYSENQHNWGVIGSATGSWDNDQDMTYDSVAKTWSITMDLTAEEIKFRSNDAWDWNYGDSGADGSLEIGGDNIAVPTAGNYTITLDLSVPRAYTYSLTLN